MALLGGSFQSPVIRSLFDRPSGKVGNERNNLHFLPPKRALCIALLEAHFMVSSDPQGFIVTRSRTILSLTEAAPSYHSRHSVLLQPSLYRLLGKPRSRGRHELSTLFFSSRRLLTPSILVTWGRFLLGIERGFSFRPCFTAAMF